MSGSDVPRDHDTPVDGARTSRGGTPVAVEMAAHPRARGTIALVVAGPIIWSVHFMLVYLVAEAGCTGGDPGLSAFAPPVPTVVTIVATVVGVLACVLVALASRRRWHEDRDATPDVLGGPDMEPLDRGGALPFVGFLLALLGVVHVLLVGAPALVLPAC